MNKNKPDYEYKQVNTRDIYVDKLYQRDLDNKRVARIADEFNPYLVNACKLSFRDGRLWVFDGQHTIAALKTRNGGKDVYCDCKVFYGLTRVDEAELFVLQNGISRIVNTNAKFRALFNTGDKDVVGMNTAVENLGLRLNYNHTSSARNSINALSALFKLYMSLDAYTFADTLSILKEIWGGIEGSFCAELLSGMGLFCATYRGQYKRSALIKRMQRKLPAEIVREGKVSLANGAKKYARVILGVYNSGTSANRLPDLL